MFGWLFGKKDAFNPDKQEVYLYHDGRRKVHGDPMAILRRLATDDGFDIDREMKMAGVDGVEGLKAYGKLVDGVRRSFELPSVQEGGLTDANCAKLLMHFIAYTEKKNASIAPSPTSASPTPAIPAVLSPLLSSSDSISSAPEAKPEEPCLS